MRRFISDTAATLPEEPSQHLRVARRALDAVSGAGKHRSPCAEPVIELDLTSAEKDAFMHSVNSVKALVELCQRIAPNLASVS